jgi:hypothetical protein
VRDALDALRGARGPRGRFKDAIDKLSESKQLATDLEIKRQTVFQFMEDLGRNKRELKQETDGWDEVAYRLELEGERAKRTVAATRAAEIGSARNAAKLARERATHARKLVDDRAKAVEELQPLDLNLN